VKKKLPSRKNCVRRLDKAFSLLIRERDLHVCQICGSRANPQCGHIFSRVAYATRWDPRNAVCMCAGCNIRHESNAWPVLKFFKDKFGEELLTELQRLWNKPRPLATWELRDMAQALEQEYKTLLQSRKGSNSHGSK